MMTTRTLAPWLLAILAACPASAQPTLPTFAVATVKPNNSMTETMGGGMGKGGRVMLRNRTLKNLIGMAYGVEDYRISGGPGWIALARYDVEAKPAAPVDYRQAQRMLQALLSDRFGVRVHHQTKTLQGYSLTIEKGARKLHRSGGETEGFQIMGPDEIRGPGGMATLAHVLTALLGAPVDDQTGLTGIYEVEMKWKVDNSPAAPLDVGMAASEPALSIFTAIKQQLGLALKPAKVPVDMIVIDHAERTPTEN
jgi:uncharacterized protein (TIGR03435 family)